VWLSWGSHGRIFYLKAYACICMTLLWHRGKLWDQWWGWQRQRQWPPGTKFACKRDSADGSHTRGTTWTGWKPKQSKGNLEFTCFCVFHPLTTAVCPFMSVKRIAYNFVGRNRVADPKLIVGDEPKRVGRRGEEILEGKGELCQRSIACPMNGRPSVLIWNRSINHHHACENPSNFPRLSQQITKAM